MPWCPKCGAEYQEGTRECSDCHVPLVEVQPKADDDHSETVMDAVTLYDVSTDIQASMLCDMLREQDIPTRVIHSGASSVLQAYGGQSNLGATILVDRADLPRAKTALDDYLQAQERAPVSDEELTRQALHDLPEDELARQALAEEKQPLEDNGAFRGMRAVFISLVVIFILVILFITLFMPGRSILGI